ncbi:MAG: phosphate acetyltransferase, partial [Treponema sp.]|nr:phosphate acetyltransferase [Treponema sp.]
MDLLQRMKTRAKSRRKTLVLPEGTEKRILRAARNVTDEGLASLVTVLGNEADVKKLASAE